MSWRSIQGQVSGGQKVTVVKSTLGGKEAVYNRLKQEYGKVMQDYVSCTDIPTFQAIVAGLKKIQDEISEATSALSIIGREWSDLLFLAQKLCVQSYIAIIKRCGANDQSVDTEFAYQLALSNHLLMDEMGKDDLLVVKHTIFLAQRIGDEWTYRRLLNEYQDKFEGIYSYLLVDIPQVPAIGTGVVTLPVVPTHHSVDAQCHGSSQRHLLHLRGTAEALNVFEALVQRLGSCGKEESSYSHLANLTADALDDYFSGKIVEDEEVVAGPSLSADIPMDEDEFIPESQLPAVAEEGKEDSDPSALLAAAEMAVSEKPELPKPERMSTRKNRLQVQSDGNSREAGNDTNGGHGPNDVPQELQAIQSICDNWMQSMPELNKFLTAEGLAEAFPSQEEVEDAAEAAKAAEVAQAAEEQAKKELEVQRQQEEEARRKRLAERGDEVREMPCLDWLVGDLRKLLELLDEHYNSPSLDAAIGRHLLHILSQWTSSFVDVPIGLVRYHLKTFPWAKLSIVALRCGAALLQWQRFLPSSNPFAFLELPDHASRLATQVLLAECSIAVHMIQFSRSSGSYADELSGQILHHLFSQWALDGTFDDTDGFALRFRTLWVSMRWLFAKYISVQTSSASAASSKTTAAKSSNNAKRKKAGSKGSKDESGESESSTMCPLWITEMNMDFATLLQTILCRLRGMTQEIGDRTLYLLHTPNDWQTVDSFTLSSLITKGDQCLQQYLLNVSLEESRRMLDRDVHKQLESFDVEQLRKFIDSLSYDLLDSTDDDEDTADDRAFQSSSSTSPPWVVSSSENDASVVGTSSTGTMVLPLLMNFSGLLGDKRYGEAAKLIQLLFRHVHDLVEATLRSPSSMMNSPTASTASLLAASSTHFQRGFRGFLRKLVPYVTWIWGNPSIASHVDTAVLLDIVRLSQRMFLGTYVAAQAFSTSSAGGSGPSGFVSAQTTPIVSMLWRVFVLVGRYASTSLVPTNGEPSSENKANFQSLVHDQLRPVAHRFLYEWLDSVLEYRSSIASLAGGENSLTPITIPRGGETLMAASVLTSLSRLGDLFLLSQCHHTSSTLSFALSNDECIILATTLLTDLAPQLLQQQKLQTDQNMTQLADLAHTIVLLVGSSLSRATDESTSVIHTPLLALPAEERFHIANFLDELMLDSLSSTDRFVAAMASLQDLTMPCLSHGAEDTLSVANFQDACVIVSHTCSVMYDFPIGGLNHLRSGQYQSPTITAMTRMYSLLKACGNMKSFTKSNLREAQQWIALQEVLQTAIIGRGPYRPQLQSFLNLDKWACSSLAGESPVDIPDIRQRQQAEAFLTAIQPQASESSGTNIPVVVNVFADLLEVNAITADMLPATDELLASLKEAYPYVAYVDDHNTTVDAKIIAFVQYALEHLSYCPMAIDSWIQLLQRVEICVQGLSDFLFQHMDVIPAKPFLDRLYHRLWTMEHGLEARENSFQQDRLWKLDPECWMNEIIPAVEELYRLMTSEEYIDDYVEWLEVSMIKDLWPHHVKTSIKGTSSAAGTGTTAARTTGIAQTAAAATPSSGGSDDWMTTPAVVYFVKALLLTDLLKRLCEVLEDKLFHVTHALMVRSTAASGSSTTSSCSTEAEAVAVVSPRWDRKFYYCIEGYCVQKIMMAKNYAHYKDATVQGPRVRLLRSLLPLMESENYLDESLFAMIMTAKYRWQLRDRSTVHATKTVGKEVLALLARVQRLLIEDTQHNNYGKPSKVNASYYIASLRMKIALTWMDELLRPEYSSTASSSSPVPSIVVEDIHDEVMLLRREGMGGSISGSGSDGSMLSTASAGAAEATASVTIVPAIVDVIPDEYDESYRAFAPVLSLLWEIFVVAVKGLLDCRKRDIYHFRTHYRLSDALWQLTKRFLSYGQGFLPQSVRQVLQSLGGWDSITVERGLAELHKLFEKKRSQIVAMWSTDNPVQPWDVLLARICEFDALRRKYVQRYLQMVASCHEVDMAWQLAQQALTKIAYPAIHETLVSSVEAYLRIIQLQMDEYVLPADVLALLNTATAGGGGDGDESAVSLLPLEPQWQAITEQASLLHQHSRLFVTYLESCHQLYVGLQKRKAPVVYLQDEVEHVMKEIVQRLVPFSHAYETVVTRARTIEAAWAQQQRQVEQATTEATTSVVQQPMDVTLALGTGPMLVTDALAPPPSFSSNNGQGPLTLQQPPPSIGADEVAYPSTVSSMDLSVSGLLDGVTPRRDLSGGPTPLPTTTTAAASSPPLYTVATLPTIPKVHFDAEWDTKDLLAAVAAILTVPKATTTAAAGQSTTTGNKRGRPSQQTLNHDGTHDGPPPSKQARRSTSASQLTSTATVPAANTGSSSSTTGTKALSMSGFGLLTESVDDGYPCSVVNDGEAMDEEIML